MIHSKILRDDLCLLNNNKFPKLIFFTGKGGVGKTTCSSSLGNLLSKLGNKVMIISTDPAHSLGDSFDVKLKRGIITNTFSNSKLYLLELSLDPQECVSNNNKNSFLSDVLYPSSEEFLIMSEVVVTLLKIIASGENFDYIIFDMAPSGHSLRILQFPKKLKEYVNKIFEINQKIMKISQIDDGYQEDFNLTKQNINLIVNRLQFFHKMLSNPNICQYIIVGIPEYMSYIESVKLNEDLKRLDINCENFIINKLELENPDSKDCQFCKIRQDNQKNIMNLFKNYFINYNLISIPLSNNEIHGIEKVEKIESYIKEIL